MRHNITSHSIQWLSQRTCPLFSSAFLAYLSFLPKAAHVFSLKIGEPSFLLTEAVHFTYIFLQLVHFYLKLDCFLSSFLLLKVVHLCYLTHLFTLGTWCTLGLCDHDIIKTSWFFFFWWRYCVRIEKVVREVKESKWEKLGFRVGTKNGIWWRSRFKIENLVFIIFFFDLRFDFRSIRKLKRKFRIRVRV